MSVLLQAKQKGQATVELALSLGMILALLFSATEVTRLWMAHNACQAAALDGAYTAAAYQNPAWGQRQIIRRLGAAKLKLVSQSVTTTDSGKTYQASVSSEFVPLFSGLELSYPGGSIEVFPVSLPIVYSAQAATARY